MRLTLTLLVLLMAFPALAQEGNDFDRRLELAQQMHDVRPAREQVDGAIAQAAQRLPPQEREAFQSAMRRVLNYKAIEQISIDAMAETFTLDELEAMVAYHSTPEAKSISDKYDQYWNQVQPEIIQMIDRALMRVRTGGN